MNKAPKREFIMKDDTDQCYGTVTKLLGNGRMMVMLEGAERVEKQCTVRGSMRKREWVNANDVVLVAFREFGDTHDIIRRYTLEETQYLKRLGELELPSVKDDENDDCIVFEDVDTI